MHTDAASKKTQAKTTTKNFMKAVKKFDSKGMNKYVKSWGYRAKPSDFNDYPYMKKYFKWTNKKLSYKILSTSVSGKTAKVKLRVKYINSKNYTDTLFNELISYTLTLDDLSEEDLDAVMNKCTKSAYKSAIKSKRKYKTETVTITFGKYNGKWKIKKMSKKLENIIYANFPYCLEHFWEE